MVELVKGWRIDAIDAHEAAALLGCRADVLMQRLYDAPDEVLPMVAYFKHDRRGRLKDVYFDRDKIEEFNNNII